MAARRRGLPSGRGADARRQSSPDPSGFVATVNQQFWDSTPELPGGPRRRESGPRPTATSGPDSIHGSILGSAGLVSCWTRPSSVRTASFFVTATVGPLDLKGPSKIVVLQFDRRAHDGSKTATARHPLDPRRAGHHRDHGRRPAAARLRSTPAMTRRSSRPTSASRLSPTLWAGDPSGKSLASSWTPPPAGCWCPRTRCPTRRPIALPTSLRVPIATT